MDHKLRRSSSLNGNWWLFPRVLESFILEDGKVFAWKQFCYKKNKTTWDCHIRNAINNISKETRQWPSPCGTISSQLIWFKCIITWDSTVGGIKSLQVTMITMCCVLWYCEKLFTMEGADLVALFWWNKCIISWIFQVHKFIGNWKH